MQTRTSTTADLISDEHVFNEMDQEGRVWEAVLKLTAEALLFDVIVPLF